MKRIACLLVLLGAVGPLRAEEPKKAFIFVVSAGAGSQIFPPSELERRRDAEKNYYEAQGYKVEVAPATQDAVFDAIASGAFAISYLGPAAEGALEPTLLGLNARVWKGAAAVYYSMKHADVPKNLGLQVLRNFSCRSLWDNNLAELFVRPGGHYFGAKSDLAHDPSYEKLAGVVEGCTQGGDCRCATVGLYSAGDLRDYELPRRKAETAAVASAAPSVPVMPAALAPAALPAVAVPQAAVPQAASPALPPGPLSGTWYISPTGTIVIDQRGEQVSWVLTVPDRSVRHEGHGTFSNSMLNGAFEDAEVPTGLRAGEFKGFQLASEGKLCGQVRWWNKIDAARGSGMGFDCYSRQPLKK